MSENSTALYHSGHLIMLSKQAYERSLVKTWEAMASIVLSFMGFECFINEFEERLEREYLHQGLDSLSKLREALNIMEEYRVSLLAKVDMIHLSFVGFRMDRGKLPYQDLIFLTKLRNALVHRRPEKFEWEFENQEREYESHKFVDYLVQRKIIQKPDTKNPPAWSQYVLVPEVANWAYNNVIEMIKQIASWLPPGNFRKTIEFTINNWNKIKT